MAEFVTDNLAKNSFTMTIIVFGIEVQMPIFWKKAPARSAEALVPASGVNKGSAKILQRDLADILSQVHAALPD